MNLFSLLDGPSVVIVFGGTVLATVLRCGLHDCAEAVRATGGLWRKRFDGARVRAELALQVQEIHRDGILRVQPHEVGDGEFDEVADALIAQRSIGALLAAHEQHRARRQALSDAAVRTLSQAAELAPVFGLAGTLLSLTQLPSSGVSGSEYAATISTAVLTTLYGLLASNLLFAPLARMVERAAAAEEQERQSIVDWLAGQVEADCPTRRNRAQDREAA